jgi:hypothetical protein
MWSGLARRGAWFPRNFGDELSPLVAELAFETSVKWASARDAEVFGLGSILEIHRQSQSSAIIWGSGVRSQFVKGFNTPSLSIVALRGVLTSEVVLGAHGGDVSSTSLGDPGLLVRDLNLSASHRAGGLALLPHFSAFASLTSIRALRLLEDSGFRVLNPWWSPEKVLREISSVDYLATSSLHGLVCANSVGTPASLVTLGEEHEPRFKYDDYLSVFNAQARFHEFGDLVNKSNFLKVKEDAESEALRLVPLVDGVINNLMASARNAKALL